MKAKPAVAAIAALLGVILLAGAIQAKPEAPRQPKAPEEIWRATCGYCHGGPMKAPELRGLKLPQAFIIRTVQHGAAGMPPFHPSSISDAELAELARWIAAHPTPQAQP